MSEKFNVIECPQCKHRNYFTRIAECPSCDYKYENPDTSDVATEVKESKEPDNYEGFVNHVNKCFKKHKNNPPAMGECVAKFKTRAELNSEIDKLRHELKLEQEDNETFRAAYKSTMADLSTCLEALEHIARDANFSWIDPLEILVARIDTARECLSKVSQNRRGENG